MRIIVFRFSKKYPIDLKQQYNGFKQNSRELFIKKEKVYSNYSSQVVGNSTIIIRI